MAGLYLHIPFCRVKCIYCDFYSVADRDEQIPAFVSALNREINLVAQETDIPPVFTTLFVGGGTPSLLDPRWMDQIMNTLHRHFDLSSLEEITLEANPGEAPAERLKDFRRLGFNRLSIGFQSFQPRILKFLSRIHSTDDCFRTFQHAREAGFDNISTDMIFNIPGQTPEEWEKDLRTLIDLSPEHISAYSLTVEEGTPLKKLVTKKNVVMPDEATDIRIFKTTRAILQREGFIPYEISNFARQGFQCRHNLGYWHLQHYLGFGPSAHSYINGRRWWNTSSLNEYLRTLDREELPIAEIETLTDKDKFNELIFNGLRLREGLSLKRLKAGYTGDFQRYLFQAGSRWPQLTIEGDNMRLSEEGVLLADEIASDLFVV